MDQPAQPPNGKGPAAGGERAVYVIPQEAVQAYSGDGLTLLEVWRILWRGKWLGIGVTTLFAAAAIAYALNATEWYTAEVLLAPAEERSTQGLSGALGGLASLAGVSVGGGSREALAVLTSRDLTREFIEDQDLLPVLFEDAWDEERGDWKPDVEEPPDIRDAVRYFADNVRSVTEDSETALVTLAITWKDPEVAAEWANRLVDRLNDKMRQRALVEAEANVRYLQKELSETSIVTLQQSIGRLLESELQKLMLARGNEEFAFRIMDRAEAPKERSRPRRALIVVLATIAGGFVAVTLIFTIHLARSVRSAAENE